MHAAKERGKEKPREIFRSYFFFGGRGGQLKHKLNGEDEIRKRPTPVRSVTTDHSVAPGTRVGKCRYLARPSTKPMANAVGILLYNNYTVNFCHYRGSLNHRNNTGKVHRLLLPYHACASSYNRAWCIPGT